MSRDHPDKFSSGPIIILQTTLELSLNSQNIVVWFLNNISSLSFAGNYMLWSQKFYKNNEGNFGHYGHGWVRHVKSIRLYS